MTPTIRQKLLGLSLLGLVLVLGAGAVGTVAVDRLQDANAQVVRAGAALKHQMHADMMHDALRGDVLRAQLAAQRSDAALDKEVTDDVAEHAQDFVDSVDALAALAVDDEIGAAVKAIRPAIDDYVSTARRTVAQATTQRNVEDAQLAEFQRSFTTLEHGMGALSELIVQRAQALQDGGEQLAGQARIAIGAAALVAGALLFAAGWAVGTSITRPIGRAVKVAQAVAAGDLRSRIEVRGGDETAELLKALDTMNGNLVSLVGEVRSSSADIAGGAGDVAHGSTDLNRRTAETAGQLQGAAASMARLTTVLGASAEAASQAGTLAASAREVAARGGAVVAQVVQTMDDIESRSRRIEDIVGTIDGIAFQTNILALNAAVEAARAGEQGRGFAVVAGEVRSLAQRAGAAAREIKGLIGSSVERVHEGARLVADAGRTMDEIVASVHRVDAIVGEITRAAAEQRDGIGQVNAAVGRLDEMTQHNAALVGDSAGAAQRLKSQADRLATLVDTFRLEGA